MQKQTNTIWMIRKIVGLYMKMYEFVAFSGV